MTTITATAARRCLYRLLDTTNESHVPIHITGRRKGGVLLSEDDWSSIKESLFLNSIPGMSESIVQGMKTPVSKCSKTVRW